MKKIFFCLAVFFVVHSVSAAEYIEGRIRLVINEHTGRFSLYYMADMASEEYLPFFLEQDPRTSFLSLMVNNRSYRMGESSVFKTTLGGTPSNPALIFESSFLTVTEEFSFIRTGSSSLTNGVRITITITNKGERPVEAGLRLLIDTTLGEKTPSHFATDLRQINGETVIDGSSKDNYWLSRNNRLTLMGSVDGQNLTRPNAIHFANWKRLNDVPWKIPYMPERNFNLLPYSIDDSAVCYYFDPVAIPQGGSRTVAIVLASGDEMGFAQSSNVPDDLSALIRESANKTEGNYYDSIRTDLITLRDLAARLDSYIASGVAVPDEELAAIGLLISRIRSKHGIP